MDEIIIKEVVTNTLIIFGCSLIPIIFMEIPKIILKVSAFAFFKNTKI